MAERTICKVGSVMLKSMRLLAV